MKIHNGFISNSSSTSFCIIGTGNTFWIHQLAEAEGLLFREMDSEVHTRRVRGCECPEVSSRFCPECGAPMWKDEVVELEYTELYCGQHSGRVVDFYGSYGSDYAGIDAARLLEDLSIGQARVYFCKLVQEELGVSIPAESVDLHYGEAGND